MAIRGGIFNAHPTRERSQSLGRMKLDQGELVPIGLRDRGYTVQAYGSASIGAITDTNDSNIYGVPGGFSFAASAVSANTIIPTARLAFSMYGRRIAIAFNGQSVANASEVDIFVNRELVYHSDLTVRHNGVGVAASEGHRVIPIAEDLPDEGPHTVEVVAVGGTIGTAAWLMYDALGERKWYGGRKVPDFVLRQTPVTMTSSNQVVGGGGHANVVGVGYTNTDTVDHYVTVSDSGGVIRVFKVPAQVAASGNVPAIPGFYFDDWCKGRGVAAGAGTYNHKIDSAGTAATVTARVHTGT